MVLVIPEIRLFGDRCILCIKGENNTNEQYSLLSEDPSQLCCLLRTENAKSIHVTIEDEKISEDNLNQIIQLTKVVDIPIQVSANFSEISQCDYLLNNGVFRIFLCLLSDFNSNEIGKLVKEYSPYRICARLEVKGTKIVSRKSFDIDIKNYMYQLNEIGLQRVLYKDNTFLMENKSYDLEFISELSGSSKLKVTLYNGIKNAEDLWILNEYIKFGIDSVVLGESLYHNYFPCQTIWRMAEQL